MVLAPRHTRLASSARVGPGWLPTAVAALVFAAQFLRIRQWWYVPSERSTCCYPVEVAERVLAGTARAPDQYRFLGPHLAELAARVGGVALPTGMLVVDAAALVGVVVLLHVLAARAGVPWLPVAAAAGWAFWASKLDHWDPNVAPTTLAVTAAVVVLAEPRARWAAPAVLALGAALCGLRTDYAAGLGLAAAAVGATRRAWPLTAAGVVVLAGSQPATWALVQAFPQARYESAVVQLDYNLGPGPLAMVAVFYLPLLLPAIAYVARSRALPPLWFVPAWFLAELAVVFVVGRPDETRIFLPLAPALAVSAALTWTALQRRSQPVEATVER